MCQTIAECAVSLLAMQIIACNKYLTYLFAVNVAYIKFMHIKNLAIIVSKTCLHTFRYFFEYALGEHITAQVQARLD